MSKPSALAAEVKQLYCGTVKRTIIVAKKEQSARLRARLLRSLG